ncbi:MAG: IS66 family transposase [Verrucomicrobiales bacterium]|nr:IS66 family transposase [Verrucomicrobiales bacterium]
MKSLPDLNRLVLPPEQREAFLAAIRPLLPPEQFEFVQAMVEAFPQIKQLLEGKNLSIARLRQVLFGAATEKTATVCPPAPSASNPKGQGKRRGHGRRPARAYTGARRQTVRHPRLRPGDQCPECGKGRLRRQPQPAPVVRVEAQPPFPATVFEKEVLRCNLCGKTFTAPTPPEAGESKYAPEVGVLVSLLRYGSGMPHYRLEKLQASLGVPLPAATQWERVAEVARLVQPVGDHLKWLAAQAPGVHNDDTPMRVGQLRQQIQSETAPERTGIFTTGILASFSEHPIALFFTGRQHAGENLEDILSQRAEGLPPPWQMADGLSRNRPKSAPTLEGCCLSHGRRGLVQVADDFPEEVRRGLESVRAIYRFEALAKQQRLDPVARLRFHQTHSQPLMEALKAWLDEQIEGHRVEPNSTLGEAIGFMRRHWGPLTLFLREPGAPLDNNLCEQILKMAILHRKNSLSFKTQHGAQVGDLFMSLIQTCRLNRVNPWDYLMALVRHPDQVRANPEQWLPWNYQDALESAKAPASTND